ncbi:unnamed protein product [Symbiodinium sp. CCMP2592]|nr:unnamed protein product [Symbiodinium sp. CCMP2592]
MIAVLDGFVDEELRQSIMGKLSPLPAGERTVLSQVPVSRQLEQRLQSVLRWCADGRDPKAMALEKQFSAPGPANSLDTVLMPGRVAIGSSPMHQDTGFDATGKPDPAYVKGFVAVLYLAGSGRLTIHSSSEEHVVEVKPARLVVWPNDRCIHRLDAGSGSRMMLGPMALDLAGWKRAGDQYACSAVGSQARAIEMAKEKEDEERARAAEKEQQSAEPKAQTKCGPCTIS